MDPFAQVMVFYRTSWVAGSVYSCEKLTGFNSFSIAGSPFEVYTSCYLMENAREVFNWILDASTKSKKYSSSV